MVENTDLDLAIAVALADSNEALSDDDFKPSGINQKLLFKTYRNSCRGPKKKELKKKQGQKEDYPTCAEKGLKDLCQVEDLSQDATRQKKDRKEVKKGAIIPRQHNSAVNGDAQRTKTFSVPDLDNFRFRGGLVDTPALVEAAPFKKDGLKSEALTAKLNSVVELGSPPLSDADNLSRSASVIDHKEDCFVIDINTDEVVELSNESQFSVLLRLCGEECVQDERAAESGELDRVLKHHVVAPVDCISAVSRETDAAVGKESPPHWDSVEAFESIAEDVVSASITDTVWQGSVPRDLVAEKDTSPVIIGNQTDPSSIIQQGNDSDGQKSQDQLCEDNTDDISSMMTQKCFSKLEEVNFPHRISPLPLQNISNLSTRPDTDKQRAKVKPINQAPDSIDSRCMDTEDALDKNEAISTRESVLESPEEDNCPSNNVVEQLAVSRHARECSLEREGQEAVVENVVSPSEQVVATITCPVCGDNLCNISVAMRVTHTNFCLDKLDSVQRLPEENGFRNAASLVPASDQVRDWLETLSLSRYYTLFVEQEIDWDTLQWLTDEDLVVMGIAAVGPRRKILRALQELRSGSGGSRTDPLTVPVAIRVTAENTSNNPQHQTSEEDRVSRNPQANGGESSNLITNYFALPLESAKKQPHDKSMMNKVHQSVTGVKEFGVYKNKAIKRPRNSIYQSLNGVPAWMCIPGTPFRVDAFQHLTGDCSHWFLTHFHTDHYQGLTRGFRYGHIFCSLITARLVNLRIGVSWDKLMIIPLNEKYKIAGVDVTFIDANHCPGSVMILFEPPNGEAVLHTGDFRMCTAMVNNPLFQTVHIHTLVLDTTYCDPQYDFPTQETVIRFVIEAIQAESFNSNTLFLIGTYTIGKERIFLEVAKVLKKYVYVGGPKKKLLECMDLPADDTQWLTCNEQESFIHVVPLWSISSFKRMSSISRHYQDKYKLIIAFSPSGWSFGRGKKKTPGKRWQQGTMIRYEVPYSEHCSFSELKEFLKFTGPDYIIPSVPGKSGRGADEMIATLWSEEN